IVGLFQRNGTAQLIVIIVIETIYFGLQLFKCPYATNQINIFYITIGFFRLSHVLLNIVYLPSLQLSEHDKQVVAYVQICFHMLCFILLFSFTLKNLFNILLGTLDNQFKGQNPVPAVRMLRWRRYK
ncbi:uncharacterized protein BX663DRAFT_420334, partial [Cokeromyces recurvatus]|uniref:uncharacterized protein n=1 Tax=Cokeromyces recurvatus TaxID=90255 RepID=UPI0022210622